MQPNALFSGVPAAGDDPLRPADNPLAQGSPTWADAYDATAPLVRQHFAQQAADWKRPEYWQDVAGQYANALMMGTTAPGMRGGASLDNPAFAKWFGKSQVVDEAGGPLTVYHGTNRQFSEFKPQPAMRSDGQTQSQAHFFTPDRGTAKEFAYNQSQVDVQLRGKPPGRQNVGDYHLSIEQPLDFLPDRGSMPNGHAVSVIEDIAGYTPETWGHVQAALDDPQVIAGLKARGYDGARLLEDNGAESWAVFDPTQVKSASKNRGTFDPNDPRFKYGVAGLAAGGAAAAGTQGDQ